MESSLVLLRMLAKVLDWAGKRHVVPHFASQGSCGNAG